MTAKKPLRAEWLSTVDYGRIYGVDSRTVRKWMDAGLLQTYRVKKTIRVRNEPPRAESP